MMEALRSSESFLLTKATQRNIPENGIPHSHLRENRKSSKSISAVVLKPLPNVHKLRKSKTISVTDRGGL
jgi:hypothetical protein